MKLVVLAEVSGKGLPAPLSCQGIAERATRRVVESFRLFDHDGLSHLHLIRTRKQHLRWSHESTALALTSPGRKHKPFHRSSLSSVIGRSRTRMPVATALLGAGESEPLAQRVQECCPGIDDKPVRCPVHPEGDLKVHSVCVSFGPVGYKLLRKQTLVAKK